MTEGPGRLGGLSLRARLTVLLVAVATLLIGTLGAQLAFEARLANKRDHLLNVDAAAATVGDLRTAVLDQESGVKGFALTQDPRFLQPYEQGRVAADDALVRIDRTLSASPHGTATAAELALVQRVRVTLSDWRRNTADVAVNPANAAVAKSTPFLLAGENRFSAVRGAITDLDSRLMAERAADIHSLDRTFRATTITVGVQAGALVLIVVAVAVMLSRQVLSPLGRLGRDARTVADGNLSLRVQGDGPPELVQLGQDVEAMRARIVAEVDGLTAARSDLERQARELARSNADLEQFAYVASHDLQEPLRKVSGFCQLLERRYGGELDDRAREYIRYAADGARRMQALINDLLTFARVGRTTERFRSVNLSTVAAEAVEALAAPIAAGGAVVTIGDLPTVQGDSRLLELVFQNLIGNGVKFRRETPPRVNVTAICKDEEWIVSVADNGIGVDPVYADQIFTLFGRLHNKTEYGGTGIGLAVSKKIVEFHGGHIWLERSDEQGATFAFALPTSGPRAPTTSNASESEGESG